MPMICHEKSFTSFQLDSPLTSLFYSLLSICHINKCKKFGQFFFFCVYKLFKKKKFMWFMLINGNFIYETR